MAKARFESYVEERVAELASAKRAKLKAAVDAEVAKLGKQCDRYVKAVEDGVKALVSKVAAQANEDGCAVGETGSATATLTDYLEGKVKEMVGFRTEYDYDTHVSRWPKGTPARKAQDALEAFDALCAKEAKRITVYKMDLGMKPEAFERMLAEAAEKINKE